MHTIVSEKHQTENIARMTGRRMDISDKTEKQNAMSMPSASHSNRGVLQRMTMRQPLIQAKLKIGQPEDKYEQEADQVAEEIIRMLESHDTEKADASEQHRGVQFQRINPEEELRRQPTEEEEEEETLQTMVVPNQTPAIPCALEAQLTAIRGGGQPLPTYIRTLFEQRFGYDFSQVRVHNDTESDTFSQVLNARAFTTGEDIFFRQEAYNPSSSVGRKLLTHELIHVVQQVDNGLKGRPAVGRPGSGYVLRRRSMRREGSEAKEENSKSVEEEKKRLEAVLKKVDEMISSARKLGANYAAENLEYWRSKKAGTKIMPASAFKDQQFIVEWLRGTPRTKFMIGAEKRLKSGKLVSGGTAQMYWIDSLYAPEGHELYYALGGFTIRSDVIIKAVRLSPEEGDFWLVSFLKWTCQATDDYNWDKLKKTIIPLFGEISDDDLRLLEKHGYGRSFKIESKPWIVTDPKVLQEFAVEP